MDDCILNLSKTNRFLEDINKKLEKIKNDREVNININIQQKFDLISKNDIELLKSQPNHKLKLNKLINYLRKNIKYFDDYYNCLPKQSNVNKKSMTDLERKKSCLEDKLNKIKTEIESYKKENNQITQESIFDTEIKHLENELNELKKFNEIDYSQLTIDLLKNNLNKNIDASEFLEKHFKNKLVPLIYLNPNLVVLIFKTKETINIMLKIVEFCQTQIEINLKDLYKFFGADYEENLSKVISILNWAEIAQFQIDSKNTVYPNNYLVIEYLNEEVNYYFTLKLNKNE